MGCTICGRIHESQGKATEMSAKLIDFSDVATSMIDMNAWGIASPYRLICDAFLVFVRLDLIRRIRPYSTLGFDGYATFK